MAIDTEFEALVHDGVKMHQMMGALPSVISDARQSAGLSQRMLAKRCGLQRTYISKLENGRVDPTIRSLLRVAEGLRVPASKLIERAETQMTSAVMRRRAIGRLLGTVASI